MNFALGMEVGGAICAKVGIDPKLVSKIVVTIDPGDAVVVEVHMLDAEGEVSDTILGYGLVPLDRS